MKNEPANKCPVCFSNAKVYRNSSRNPFVFIVECEICLPPTYKKFEIDTNTITAIARLNQKTRSIITKNIVEENYVNEGVDALRINEENLDDYKKIKYEI